MSVQTSTGELIVAGRRLEVQTIPGARDKAAIVMLHEGLGSVAMWRDFPERLASATGRTVVTYSRYGHGRSEILTQPRTPDYMHEEAEWVLPPLFDALRLERPVLFGHSDGASIALIYAARFPERITALILEAPHVFVENLTVDSIAKLKDPQTSAPLIERLRRYHDDAQATFRGWNDIWLEPAFRSWDIRNDLPAIAAPTLLIQGRDDEYGTLAHIDTIASTVPNAESLIFEESGHSPHRTHAGEVAARTAAFLAMLR